MVNDPKTVNMVEAIIQKGKPFLSVGNFKSSRDAEQAKTLLCKLYRSRREIHPDVSCSILCELETIRSYAAPDFENVLPIKRGELSHDRYMPLTPLITSFGDVLEISAAILFRGQVRLAGVRVPEASNFSYSHVHILNFVTSLAQS